jgi:Zn finger protein HypA/HybF involved in hydrogenase expression
MYIGLSASLQPLHVSSLNFVLRSNVFALCVADVATDAGNAYGGAVSVYVGAYASAFSTRIDVKAALGDTFVQNASVLVDTAQFSSCSASRKRIEFSDDSNGANVYGGEFSFYIGAYAWSRRDVGISTSTCGVTNVSGVSVRIFNITSFAASVMSTSGDGMARGASVYGGSLSVLYIGAYAWSSSTSSCGSTIASDVSVHVSDSLCSGCSAVTTTVFAGNAYGGSMSVLYIGAYAWSAIEESSSSCRSLLQGTVVNGIAVVVRRATCTNCTALSSTIRSRSNGANVYGGSMSVLHVGAYAWSFTTMESYSQSLCDSTIANRVSVQIHDWNCLNCSAKSKSGGDFIEDSSNGANVYGGSISAAYFGAYAYNYAQSKHSDAYVEDTLVTQLEVVLSNSTFNDSMALSG